MTELLRKTSFLFRRELWENKTSVLWVPATLAAITIALLLVGHIFGVDELNRHVGEVMVWAEPSGGGEEETRRLDFSRGEMVADEADLDWLLWGSRLLEVFQPSMHGIALGFELIGLIVAFFYLLGSLFSDRKDRSVLFWKSLPFSETQSVFVKLLFAMLVIPLVALVISLAVQLTFGMSIIAVIIRNTDFGFLEIFGQVSFLSVFLFHLLLVLVCAVKNLPLFSWLLFASAVSKRSPFLTAIIPIVAIGSLEALVLGSDYFFDFIEGLFFYATFDTSDETTFQQTLTELLTVSPMQLVKILGVSIPLIGATVWLRNHRYEI